jgi:protein-disulfide isomerase
MSSRAGRKQAARVVREQLARERRRKRTLWTSVVAVAALVIAGMIGWAVYSSQRSADFLAPRGANEGGTGIVVGSGPVTVDVYEDFICPACGQFERSSGATLDQLVADGEASIVYHPVAFLDRASTTRYSTRSSAASGCAADGGKYREYAKALFARQPAEGSAGLSDDELISIGTSMGLDQDTFGSCVREGTYRSWTEHVTDAASGRGVTGTPTVLVAGAPVQASSEAITAAVQAVGK